MPKLALECKKIMVREIVERLNRAGMLVVTNFRGLSAQDFNELRRELRNISADYMVINNAMAKRALKDSPHNRIEEFISGEVGIALDSGDDPTYVSKVLARFAKDHEVLKIYGGINKGDTLTADDIKRLASLPSREVLLGKVANVLNAPIQGLAGALSAIICKFLYALNAVKDKKGQ